jgi:hypothetical protein
VLCRVMMLVSGNDIDKTSHQRSFAPFTYLLLPSPDEQER